MTSEQQHFLNKLELALAHMSFDGHTKWANAWSKVIEWLNREEPEIAVLEGENLGIDKRTLDCIREKFDIRY